MTDAERQNTMRVLAKRNKSRLEALKARDDSEPEGSATTTTATAGTGGAEAQASVRELQHKEL